MTELLSIQSSVSRSRALASDSFEEHAVRLRQSKIKRVIDLAGALFGLVFLSPVFVLIALIIRIESKGPALFRQRRTGFDGKTFLIFKFRSMRVMEDGPQVTHAVRGDDRVTAFGKFLRRSSLDELPQLLNVLVGEMSLVGPRPHAVAHDEHYTTVVRDYPLRFIAKPGITGLAQISGHRGEVTCNKSMSGRVAYDMQYIGSWSLLLDIQILLRTIFCAPFHTDAY